MPGLNGTGPMSNGPMTGGRRGLCNPENQRLRNQLPGRSAGFGRGMGFGRGLRDGSGMGMRRGLRNTFQNQPVYNENPEDELNILKSEAASVKSMLEAINKKIIALEKT